MLNNSAYFIAIFCGLIIVGCCWVLMSAFEANSFNKCTGGNATVMDAMMSELRIDKCNREQSNEPKNN